MFCFQSLPQPSPSKALHSCEGKEPGDLRFSEGDVMVLRHRVDERWYHGLLPASYVQGMRPLPQSPPQGKALYDFEMKDRDQDKDCLTFSKVSGFQRAGLPPQPPQGTWAWRLASGNPGPPVPPRGESSGFSSLRVCRVEGAGTQPDRCLQVTGAGPSLPESLCAQSSQALGGVLLGRLWQSPLSGPGSGSWAQRPARHALLESTGGGCVCLGHLRWPVRPRDPLRQTSSISCALVLGCG